MAVIFPPLNSASPEGLLAVGGQLDLETLLTAYKSGIFPWPISKNSPITWFSPDPRGILEFKNFHVSKSFNKFLKKNPFTVKYNQNFKEVIKQCSFISRKHEKGTWISQDIIDGYHHLFENEYAYSIEVYDKNNDLVGGLFGVCIGSIISGESMFYLKDNASKVAFYYLITGLQKAGIEWIDTQMVTPIISSFGGTQIRRAEYIRKLNLLDPNLPTRDELFSHF